MGVTAQSAVGGRKIEHRFSSFLDRPSEEVFTDRAKFDVSHARDPVYLPTRLHQLL